MRRADFDVFLDKFEPELDDGDFVLKMYETYGEDIKTIGKLVREEGENRLWTVVDGDNGKLYICPGLHYVNRLNYLITKHPWEEGQRNYLF